MTARLSQQGGQLWFSTSNNLAAPSRNLDVTHTLELCQCTSEARTTGLTADFLPHLGIAQACNDSSSNSSVKNLSVLLRCRIFHDDHKEGMC
jgi:hypothetical protein